MTDNELKKLNRKELLEMLIEQEKEIERLQAALSEAEEQLNSREIKVSKAGTMAEAALALNGVYEAVDAAAKQYLESIQRSQDEQQTIYDSVVNEAQQKAESILRDAEIQKLLKIKEADEYWATLSGKMESFYQSHLGLKELLSIKTGSEQ